jgi:hypothetical protein
MVLLTRSHTVKVIYEHLNFPEYHQPKMGGQLIVELYGSRYKVVFDMDCSYAFQCNVMISVLAKDEGWKPLLVQAGVENPMVAKFYAWSQSERAQMHKSGSFKRSVEVEMFRLCQLAAEINR